MKAKLYITFLLSWLYFGSIAQTIPPKKDSLSSPSFVNPAPAFDSTARQPALPSNTGTLPLDSVKISDDALDEVITYNAEDSMRFDVQNETVYLYGDAVVNYTTIKMTADFIVFNMSENTVIASGLIDSTGRMGGFPVFEEGDQRIEAEKIKYNLDTNRGIIYEAVTTQNDMFVRSGISEYHGQDEEDPRRKEDVIYSENAIFTTCSHPEPHFGVRSQKQKVIPDKVVVVGPSNIEVGGVPTPLVLPFAFFPLKQGPRTGLIFPRDYEYSDEWGFGLKDFGWYFPMNDYWDLTLQGMLYTRGTFGVTTNARYRKRYKYSGNISLGFSNRINEIQAQRLKQQSYSIRWSHSQDSKAHPTNRFSGSVNIQTNNYQSLNNNDAQAVLQNTLSSSVSFSKSFPGKPFSLAISMNHSQNTQTRRMDITLPSVNFNMNRIYPFKRKNALDNKERWYEKVSFQYKGVAQNRFTATDTTLFSQQTLDDARFGIRHTLNSNASFRVFKYFNLTPSVEYKENWYFDRTQKILEEVYAIDTIETFIDSTETLVKFDTTQYGQIAEFQEFAWNPLRLFKANISIGTQIFGIRQFEKGKLRGIRHVIKPSVSLNYQPDYTDPKFGYFDYVDSDLRASENDPIRYSLFENGIYDDAPTNGRQMALNYSINNIFEAKYWSKKDSTNKIFKIFDNIIVNGGYNFAADSIKWSKVTIRGTTRFFNGITTFNFNSSLDPYALDEDTGQQIATLYRNTGQGLLRYERSQFRFNTGITIKKLRALFGNEDTGDSGAQAESLARQREALASREGGPGPSRKVVKPKENFLDLFNDWRISHNIVMESTPDTFVVRTHSIQTSGSIKLTPKWNVRFGNISYDFQSKRFVYPTLGFYRDLHCWEMGMDWYPSRGTFSFFLRVKPGTLDFIKVPYGKNNADGFRGF